MISATTDRPHRGGFTLIEMMVSIALVTIIMLLFSQVFTLASDSITNQRALANNSQRARALSQVIRTDLGFRTYRQRSDAQPVRGYDGDFASPVGFGTPMGIVPLAPGDDVDPNQAGYFYISENDPNSDVDDVLQFTIMIDDLDEVEDELKEYYGGKAASLTDLAVILDPSSSDFGNREADYDVAPYTNPGNAGTADGGVETFPNDPDVDDGFGGNARNSRTRSRAAEVSLFLRGGRLYRRVMLLRDPAEAKIGSLAFGQPSLGDSGLGDRFFSSTATYALGGSTVQITQPDNYPLGPNPTTQPNVFWRDFDLSATRLPYDKDGDGLRDSYTGTVPANTFTTKWVDLTSGPTGLWINSVQSLDNSAGLANNPIALPYMRFGHVPLIQRSVVAGTGTPIFAAGTPIEWGVASTGGPAFLGRLTHNETSYQGGSSATFPGQPAVNSFEGNPFASTASGLTVRMPDGSIQQFGGPDDFVASGVVPAGAAGDRKGEDLVLSGVTAFDIEVWDEVLDQWVDLGGNASTGRWGANQQTGRGADVDFVNDAGDDLSLNSYAYRANDTDRTRLPGIGVVNYGPGGASQTNLNNVFDTWHTHFDMATSAVDGRAIALDGVYDIPPYRPLQADHRIAAVAHIDGNNVTPPVADLPAGTPGFWLPRASSTGGAPNIAGNGSAPGGGANDVIGAVTFANPYLPPYANSLTIPNGSGGTVNRQVARTGRPGQALPGPLRNGSIAFRCVEAINLNSGGGGAGANVFEQGLTAFDQPVWPTRVGERVRDNELVWEAFDNRVGLKKMRITIRYIDPRSRNQRQISLVHSFVE